ncbi:EVE domain-containing protein [Mycobacterium sp. SMC-4]|uniref:EVE domain-containing protein n=1 Tax=Mycobacterium sp. SMC-4 TaxID=2857059 RepID=UPI003CFE954F
MTNWIITASRDHVLRAVQGSFIQANHGRPHPVRAMAPGDWIICYSPRTEHPDGDRLQAFTAIGRVVDGDPYQAELSDFRPWRRPVEFEDCLETPIRPLIERLDFIEDKARWGYRFRFGGFRVDDHDVDVIRSAMLRLDTSA